MFTIWLYLLARLGPGFSQCLDHCWVSSLDLCGNIQCCPSILCIRLSSKKSCCVVQRHTILRNLVHIMWITVDSSTQACIVMLLCKLHHPHYQMWDIRITLTFVCTSRDAPASTTSCIVVTWPFWLARCRAVNPLCRLSDRTVKNHIHFSIFFFTYTSEAYEHILKLYY